MQYNNPTGGNPSTMGDQFNTYKYDRAALIEAMRDRPFSARASTREMPKHFGKKIVGYHYLPVLDDANINDQGIDATGATTTRQVTIEAVPAGVAPSSNGLTNYYGVGVGANDGAALTNARTKMLAIWAALGLVDGADDYATTKGKLEAIGWTVTETAGVPQGGNLYGSSKDIGTIVGKLPVIDENGGRKNRVGFTRNKIESTLDKYGFFFDYTKESMDFDTDDQLEMHLRREAVNAAAKMSEDRLQIDIINNAGVVRYGGGATQLSELSGEAGNISAPTYMGLLKLSISLDNNHTPKGATMITGSKMTDTMTIPASRYMYCGSELIPVLEGMKDAHDERAFVRVEKYANAGKVAKGEEGQVGRFRIITVQEMVRREGVGANVTAANAGYYNTNGKYDAFPMLVIGDDSFTTVGFQSNGVNMKFKIKHVKPESDASYSIDNDVFGERGFMSIKWYYGFFPLRTERIALYWVTAPY